MLLFKNRTGKSLLVVILVSFILLMLLKDFQLVFNSFIFLFNFLVVSDFLREQYVLFKTKIILTSISLILSSFLIIYVNGIGNILFVYLIVSIISYTVICFIQVIRKH